MNTKQLRDLLDELEEKERQLHAGAEAWSEGTDEYAMADCDPGIQFELSNEIEELQKQIRTLVGEA